MKKESLSEKKILPDEASTIDLGLRISTYLKPGDIIKITGELGAGKTTLVRGLVLGLGGDPAQVHSPTFSIVHEYLCPTGLINHCDFYRLEQGSELDEFGGAEFFSDNKFYFLEWPERIRLENLVTSDRLLHVHLEHEADGRSASVFWKNNSRPF